MPLMSEKLGHEHFEMVLKMQYFDFIRYFDKCIKVDCKKKEKKGAKFCGGHLTPPGLNYARTENISWLRPWS